MLGCGGRLGDLGVGPTAKAKGKTCYRGRHGTVLQTEATKRIDIGFVRSTIYVNNIFYVSGFVMEFRYPTASAEANMNAMKYLTQNLSVPEKGEKKLSL